MKNYHKLWGPEIISLVILIFSIYFRLNLAEFDYKFICSNCVCFVSIISGSLITMTSISMTNLSEQYLRALRILEPENSIRYYFCGPIFAGIILSVLSVIGSLIIDEEIKIRLSGPLVNGMINMNFIYITSIWLMIATYFIYSSVRSVFINIEILKVLHESKIGGSKEKIAKSMDNVCELLSEE